MDQRKIMDRRVRMEDHQGRSRQNQGNVTCIIQFGEQPRVRSINPLKLTIIINRSIGNIDFAKVLSDGKFLVGETKRKEEKKKKEKQARLSNLKSWVGLKLVV